MTIVESDGNVIQNIQLLDWNTIAWPEKYEAVILTT
jgi:hypothetical protein